MKNQFSTSWISSVQPRKQRKYVYNAPLHVRHKFLSAHLSKDLRQKYGKRNLPLRKGDEVLVMRGFFKKKKVKVSDVNHKTGLVSLEGLFRKKKDGSKIDVHFHPSNLLIESLVTEDKERTSSIQRKLPEKKEKSKSTKQSKEKNAQNKTGNNK